MVYSAVVMMVSSVRNSYGLGGIDGHHNIHQRVSIKYREKLFYQNHAKSLLELVNDNGKATQRMIALDWSPIVDDFDIHQLPKHNQTTDKMYDLVESDNLCSLVRAYTSFRNTPIAEPRPHVAWWRAAATTWNNRGQEEEEDVVAEWQEQGCSLDDIAIYLNHPETIAVMVAHNTTAVRALRSHPKLQPLSPFGLWQQDQNNGTDPMSPLEHVQALPHQGSNGSNRTTLLFLADEVNRARTESTRAHLQPKFDSYKLKTVFPNYQDPTNTLWDPLQNTQFVLIMKKDPKDLEAWVADALTMGAIPILEEDEWYQLVLSELPVIWVTHYDNLNPELLQVEWERILTQPFHFQYQQLTQSHWVARAVKEVAGRETADETDNE
jgi:hypothetical protein